ncbi:MAG: hypothetical protein ACI9YT_002718, partial [Halobacteriales archaeon]
TTRRQVAVLLLLTGVVHLLAPGRLLRVARVSYDRVLAVEFTPRDGASRRVRLVGILMCLAGVVAWKD